MNDEVFTIPPNIQQKIVEMSQEVAANFYSGIINSFEANNIFSPPEQLFYAYWSKEKEIYNNKISLMPQFKIGKFYADFKLDFLGYYVEDFLYPNASEDFYHKIDDDAPKVIIEIDGHWHEKTPEQVEKDKKRERYIINQGFIVVRFSAREIIRDVRKCVEEVMSSYNKEASKIFSDVVNHKYDK